MLAMHTVAMCDGGGGGGDSTTLLSMREVLDQATTEQSTRVLYAEPIDIDGVTAILDSLDTYSGENNLGLTTENLIRENNDMMAASNSDRFYFGTDAKTQFTAMDDVGVKIATLLGNIEDICTNRATIISSIESYNTKLQELKKDCRITLLRQAADAWNLAKHVDKTVPLTSCGYPYKDTVWGDSQYVYSEPVTSTITVNTSILSMDGNTYYDYDRVYYKIIKYWNGLKNITWFKDPGFEDVEKMFAEVGAPLPYNPDLIV